MEQIQNLHFVGNKAKGRISKRWLEGNKVRQIFQKTYYFSHPFAILPTN